MPSPDIGPVVLDADVHVGPRGQAGHIALAERLVRSAQQDRPAGRRGLVRVDDQVLDHLRDLHCRVAVLRRVDRLATGNPGDQRFCRAGVWELRVKCGPGYRVYFARPGQDRILLLGGGSKASQDADIGKAVERWKGYREQT